MTKSQRTSSMLLFAIRQVLSFSREARIGHRFAYHTNMRQASPQEEDNNILQQALERAEERALDNFIEDEAPVWMRGIEKLPFACTGCGRCCQTEGDVYLSPEETQKASDLLQLTPNEFAQLYASHMLGPSEEFDETTSWIRLKDKEGACIFLDANGKHCTIYEARPIQCRTYPFWPTVVQSIKSWESECRRKEDEQIADNQLPMWTPETGGCEGMHPEAPVSLEDGVPIREAYRQLYEYTFTDRRFPQGAEKPFVPRGHSEEV